MPRSSSSENRSRGLSCGIVCVILRSAISVEHRLGIDRHTTTAYTALAWHRAVKTVLMKVEGKWARVIVYKRAYIFSVVASRERFCVYCCCGVDFEKQVRAGVQSVDSDCHRRCLTLNRVIVDLQNYAHLPLVGRCFADVVRCPPPHDTVSTNSAYTVSRTT